MFNSDAINNRRRTWESRQLKPTGRATILLLPGGRRDLFGRFIWISGDQHAAHGSIFCLRPTEIKRRVGVRSAPVGKDRRKRTE